MAITENNYHYTPIVITAVSLFLTLDRFTLLRNTQWHQVYHQITFKKLTITFK